MHLADLTPSIFSTLHLPDTSDRMGCGESPVGRECLLLIDGLGADVLQKFPAYLPTITSLTQWPSLQSTFPSTTVTSLTTLMTGELPGVHGMLGYTMRVPRSGGRILNPLKWDERVDPVMWQATPTLFERAARAGIQVSHVAAKRYENSGFTQASFRGAHYRGANLLTELVAQSKASLQRDRSFTYLYLNNVDVAGHSDGVGSQKWLTALTYVDRLVEILLEELPIGTRLWITADHGMINVGSKIVIGEGNPLLEGVALIAGEPRARHLYLPEGSVTEAQSNSVAKRWREFLGERAEIFTRSEAIEGQLFGESASIDAAERMGDIIVIANDELILIDPARQEQESKMVGHHGGRTKIEELVPLMAQVVGA